jgi:hypothetical protein
MHMQAFLLIVLERAKSTRLLSLMSEKCVCNSAKKSYTETIAVVVPLLTPSNHSSGLPALNDVAESRHTSGLFYLCDPAPAAFPPSL